MGRLVLLIGEDFRLLAQRSAQLMRAGFSSAPVHDLAHAVSFLKKARFEACVMVHHPDPVMRESVESRLKAEQADLPILWLDPYPYRSQAQVQIQIQIKDGQDDDKPLEFAEYVRRALVGRGAVA